MEDSDLDFMPDQFQFLALQPREFNSLPAGFEYEYEISEASNTIAFDTGVDTLKD